MLAFSDAFEFDESHPGFLDQIHLSFHLNQLIMVMEPTLLQARDWHSSKTSVAADFNLAAPIEHFHFVN